MNQPSETPPSGRQIKVSSPGSERSLQADNPDDLLAYHNLKGAMTSEAAQDAYREGGERGYLEFLRSHLQARPPLAQLAPSDQVMAAAPKPAPVGASSRTSTNQPPPVSRLRRPPIWRTRFRVPVPPTPSQPIPTPNQVNRPDLTLLNARRESLRSAVAAYAGVTATRRADVADALLESEREQPRWRSAGRRLAAIALNPAEIWDYRRAERLQAQSNQAVANYRQALAAYAALWLHDPGQQHQYQVAAMMTFENEVRRQMQLQALSSQNPSQLERRQAQLANFWLDGGRLRRIGIVALPAVVIGASLGVATAALTAPWWGVALAAAGAGYAGRAIGGGIASTVNRRQAANSSFIGQMARQTQARNQAFIQSNGAQADITQAYEQGTRDQSRANLRRKRRAEAVGGLAAVGAFAAANAVTTGAREVMNQLYAPRSPAAVAPHPTPTPAPPPGPTIPQPPASLPYEYPWDAATQFNAAHQLSAMPGSVWHTLHEAAAQYNAAHGTHFGYVLHPNGTYWLQNGHYQLTPNQLADFNNHLWNMQP